MTDVLLRLLGPVELVADGSVVPLGPPKQRAVLTVLALADGHVVSTARLVDELWGDRPPESAVATLQAYLSRLRGSLPPPIELARQAPGYVLRLPAGGLDTGRFTRLADAAARLLDTAPGQARAHLDEALSLVRGAPLAGVLDLLGPYAAAEARRLTDRVTEAREHRIDAMLRSGAVNAALLESAEQTGEHPLRESLHALRMRALYQAGRQAEALNVFDRIRARLADELGIDPGRALVTLHQRILRQDPGLMPVPSSPRTVVAAPIGRHDQFTLLREALDAARAGAGSAWLIEGDAGIGKSYLGRAVERQAVMTGIEVYTGRADETAAAAPFWPWVEALRDLPELVDEGGELLLGRARDTGDLAAGVPPATARIYAYDGIVRRLLERARTRPLLLILEDLHWADDPSLELLSLLVRRCAGAGLVVLATCRPADGSGCARFTAEILREPHATRLELTGLEDEAIQAFLYERTGRPVPEKLVALAAERSDRNPFFLTELVRLLPTGPGADDSAVTWSDVPRAIRDVLIGRMSALPAQTRAVLDLAAVAGRTTDLRLLAQADPSLDLAAVEDLLTPAVRAGLVDEYARPRPGIAFRHALVRQTLYDELRPVTRARLHAAVGTALVGLAEPRDAVGHADEVAFHLAEGADTVGLDAVLPALLAASQEAAARFAYEHALRLLDQALALLGRSAPGDRRDAGEIAVQSRRGMILTAHIGYAAPATIAALNRVRDLATGPDLDALAFSALAGLGAAYCIAVDLPAAEKLSREFLGRPGDQWSIMGNFSGGFAAWLRGDLAAATAALRRAIEIVDASAPVSVPAGHDGIEDIAPWHEPRHDINSSLACVLALSGDGDEAFAMLDDIVGWARRAGRPFLLCRTLAAVTVAAAAGDDVDRAGDAATQVKRLSDRYGTPMWSALADQVLGWVDARRGATGGAAAIRAAAPAYAASGARMWHTLLFGLLADAELAEGNPAGARSAAEAGLTAAEQSGEHFWIDRLRRLRRRADAGLT